LCFFELASFEIEKEFIDLKESFRNEKLLLLLCFALGLAFMNKVFVINILCWKIWLQQQGKQQQQQQQQKHRQQKENWFFHFWQIEFTAFE
jgi:cell division protein FtsB